MTEVIERAHKQNTKVWEYPGPSHGFFFFFNILLKKKKFSPSHEEVFTYGISRRSVV